jgi:hypothetical protein
MRTEPHVKVDDPVIAGQPIGEVGSTGNSSGPYLHYEVHINGDLANSGAVDWPCNGGLAQTWQPQPNGTMVNPNSGRCLTATGTTAGSGAQIVDCGAAAGQIWAPQADGTVKNPASGRCLDVTGSAAMPSRNPLVVNDCNPALLTRQWTGRYLDADGLAGFNREEQALDSAQPAGSQLVASTIHDPTVTQTAVRPTPTAGGQDWTARMVTEPVTRTRTWIAADARWRWTRTDTSYDQWGLPTDVTDLGDTATGDNDRCTHTDYTRNTTTYLISFPSQVLTTDCAASPGDGDYLAGTQTFYDGTTSLTVAPTQGMATKTTALASVAGGTKTWKQADRRGYDNYGRVTSAYDALDRPTTTTFAPATGGPVTAMTVTNPMGWAVTTTVDPGTGTPTQVVDVNTERR